MLWVSHFQWSAPKLNEESFPLTSYGNFTFLQEESLFVKDFQSCFARDFYEINLSMSLNDDAAGDVEALK